MGTGQSPHELRLVASDRMVIKLRWCAEDFILQKEQFCISHLINIGRYQLSISTFGIYLLERSFSGQAVSRAARHACMQCNRSIYLAEDSKHSINFWYCYTEDWFYYFCLVVHRFISLFNSARLLLHSSLINRCVRRQHTCIMHRTMDREITLPAHPSTSK